LFQKRLSVVSETLSYLRKVLVLLAECWVCVLRVGFSWTCASCVEIDRDLDGYVALTTDRFMKLIDKLMSVVADFK